MLNKQTSVLNEYHLRDRHVDLPSTRWLTGFITALHVQHFVRALLQTDDCNLIPLRLEITDNLPKCNV